MSAEKTIYTEYKTSNGGTTAKDGKVTVAIKCEESLKKGYSEREEGELVSESEAENDEAAQVVSNKQVQKKGKTSQTSPGVDDIIVLDVSQEDIDLIEADEEFFYADYEEGEVISNEMQNAIIRRNQRAMAKKRLEGRSRSVGVAQSGKKIYTLKEKFDQLDKLSNIATAECEALKKMFTNLSKNNFGNPDDPEDGEIQSPPVVRKTAATEKPCNTSEEKSEVKYEPGLMNNASKQQAVIEVIKLGKNAHILAGQDVNYAANLETNGIKSNGKAYGDIVRDKTMPTSFQVAQQDVECTNNELLIQNIKSHNVKVTDDNKSTQQIQNGAANHSKMVRLDKESALQENVDGKEKKGFLGATENIAEVNLDRNNNNQAVFHEGNIMEVAKIVHISAEGIDVELNIGEQLKLAEETAKPDDADVKNYVQNVEILGAEAMPVYCIEIVVQNFEENVNNIPQGELNVKLVEVVECENHKNVQKSQEIGNENQKEKEKLISTTNAEAVPKHLEDKNTSNEVPKTPNNILTLNDNNEKNKIELTEAPLPFFGPEWLFPSPKRLAPKRSECFDSSPSPRLYRKERKLKILSNREKPCTNRPKPYDKTELNPPKPEPVRLRRTHRLPYCPYTSQTRTSLHILTLYDQHGRLRRNGADICDCGNQCCDGCWYNCLECGSPKCGLSCRRNRQVYPDSWHLKTIPKRPQY